jgi:hypothetical protein
MYNGTLHIYFTQHTNDTIYTTLNTHRGLLIMFPESSKIHPGCSPTFCPKPWRCHCCWQASSLYGDLKFSHALLHVPARGLRAMVKYCVKAFAILFQSTRHGKLAESFEKKKFLVSSAVRYNIQKNDKFSNYRCSHRGELPCSGDRTARPLYKKVYHKLLGLAYHLRKAEQSMDKRNHFHKYNSKSHLTKKKQLCLTLSLEYNPGPQPAHIIRSSVL